MRILMTTDTVGGVWTYTRELVAGLLQADATLEIYLFTLGTTSRLEQHGWLKSMRERHAGRFSFSVAALPLEWEQRNADVDPLEPRLRYIAETFQPDLLHSNQFCYGALPIDCPKLIVAHSDVLSWHREVRGETPESSAWLTRYEWLVRSGIHGASALAAPTMWMLQAFNEGFSSDIAACVIPNGIGLRVDLGQERRLQAVAAGRLWDAGKNINLLQQVNPAIPVLVAGQARHGNEQLEWQGSSSVELVGDLSHRELLRLFAGSAIYISTARYEPFGLSALEAARSGCAVLSLDIAPMREVWGNGAIYFRNADELTDILTHLSNSMPDFQEAQRRAILTSRQYTRQRMANTYLSVYRELCGMQPMQEASYSA